MFQTQLHNKKTSKLINLTGQIIQVYEKNSGDIVTLYPSQQQLPETPDICDPTMYIIGTSTANCLTRIKGRTLSDIAITHHKSTGRHNAEITYLIWGKDFHTEVCLYKCPR